jgi:hypothetical protein
VPGDGVARPGRGAAGCTGLAGAAGVARGAAPGRFTWPAKPGCTSGRDPTTGASRAGSPPNGRRTADDGGMMPPARGLGSPPEVGGLRDGGTAGGPALAPDAGGVAVGAEPALPAEPTASPAVGNFSAAARARTAADAAGLECEAGVCTERATPPVCGGLPAGAADEERTVPGEPTRGPGAGVRAGGAPDVGTPDPARPPP